MRQEQKFSLIWVSDECPGEIWKPHWDCISYQHLQVIQGRQP